MSNQLQPIGAFARAPSRDSTDVTLPSGRTITILETTGHEEKIFKFGGKKNIPALINQFFTGICRNLDKKEGLIEISQFENMLVGDRTAILFYSRVLTHGPLMEYNLECPHCEEKSTHEINIQEIIDSIKPYPLEDSRQSSVKLSAGEIFFELPTGNTEKKLADIQDPDVNVRLSSIRIWEKTDKGDMPVRLDNLRAKDIVLLRKAVTQTECFIDSIVKIECPSCGKKAQTTLVGDPAFLFPNMM